jgi:hypothetical protein
MRLTPLICQSDFSCVVREVPMAVDQPPPAIDCVIEADASANQIALRGRITTNAPASGRYDLTVAKTGVSGTSQIKQAGAYSALPQQSIYVGSVVLDYRPGTNYTANLVVSYGEKSFKCDLSKGRPNE